MLLDSTADFVHFLPSEPQHSLHHKIETEWPLEHHQAEQVTALWFAKKKKKTERIKNRGTQEMPTRIQTFLKPHIKQLCILLSMDNFNVHFSKTDTSVKMHCPLVD